MKIGPKGDPRVMATPFLRPGAVVVDVGANVGSFTKDALAKGCEVFAIEPDARCTWVHSVPIHRTAVGSRTRDAEPLYGFDKPEESSLYKAAVLDKRAAEVAKVPVARLDALVPCADLIKVDVQGAESDVLDGAPRLLRACPAWILEAWPYGLKQAGSSVYRLWAQLTEVGLIVTWSDGQVVTREALDFWTAACKQVGHVNWLATR